MDSTPPPLRGPPPLKQGRNLAVTYAIYRLSLCFRGSTLEEGEGVEIPLVKLKLYIMENKNIWGKILNIIITVLTAIATTFGVSSCMGV